MQTQSPLRPPSHSQASAQCRRHMVDRFRYGPGPAPHGMLASNKKAGFYPGLQAMRTSSEIRFFVWCGAADQRLASHTESCISAPTTATLYARSRSLPVTSTGDTAAKSLGQNHWQNHWGKIIGAKSLGQNHWGKIIRAKSFGQDHGGKTMGAEGLGLCDRPIRCTTQP
jgi:hypothetical protein